MKKIVVLLILLPLLLAQTVVYYDVVPIAWDAHAAIANSTVTYEVMRARVGAPGSAVVVGETALLEYDVPLLLEGDWIIGVRTVRTIDANGDKFYSPINWSDVNGVWTPDPFIVRYYTVPSMPESLRLR